MSVLALDVARQIVVHGPPWWTQLLTPGVSLLGIVAAYFLGRQQGKAQTRHDKSVSVAVEVLRKALNVAQDLKFWADSAPYDGLDAKAFNDAAYDLKTYFLANAPWLEPETIRKIDPIVERFEDVAVEVALYKSARRRAKEEKDVEEVEHKTQDLAAQVKAWFEDEADQLLEELKKESRRLIGTKPMRADE